MGLKQVQAIAFALAAMAASDCPLPAVLEKSSNGHRRYNRRKALKLSNAKKR